MPHIAATYCALCLLKIAGIDKQTIEAKLKQIHGFDITLDEEFLLEDIKQSQKPFGSISNQNWDSEDDVRFFYCACAIHALLYGKGKGIPNFSFDVIKGQEYLNSINNYEGGYSMLENGESNAGLTYCAVASFKIIASIPNERRLIHWLCSRATNLGINGRTGKMVDSCYTFWVYATMCVLGRHELFDHKSGIDFVMNCQTVYV
jgi:geranylgeranyl transferase type-1 subunit beta